ncbi:hypothetical protein HPP92_028158 [Vanilla planifolia]|uniref:Uncharacterized protein n=1 Tax=Vanilla planifolia TaxID=51239 RepID=A0A835P8X7_VANPL|nr:hypothetical protein HPP92_028158 [Vanilla planifolia]
MEVVSDGRVKEFIGVADDGVEVSLGRGDEVDIVHQKSSREVFPTPYAILKKGTRKHHPSRPYKTKGLENDKKISN